MNLYVIMIDSFKANREKENKVNFFKSIHAIDCHTMGEPSRMVVSGIPHIKGKTMAEKRQFLQENMDNVRTAIMHEPRGHNDMFGSILTEPVTEEADFGLIFMDAGGYLNMCGHGSIAAVVVAIETGLVEVVEPVTTVCFDTPAGFIQGEAKVENGDIKEVSILNVPSFLYKKDAKVHMPKFGEITFDISFGGSFFAIVDAEQFGLEIDPKNALELRLIGLDLRDRINKEIKVEHPSLEHIKTVDLVEFFTKPKKEGCNHKNAVVFGQNQMDRSPCGTGTSAKLATLYTKGKLKKGETFIHESIIGTIMKGQIADTGKLGEFETITPRIIASAYITGFNHFVFDKNDPLKYGFTLS